MKTTAILSAAFFAALSAQCVEMAEPRNVPPLFGRETFVPEDGKAWHDGRRAELKAIFEKEVYGKRPVERPPHLAFSAAAPDEAVLDGKAVKKTVRIEYGGAFGTNSFTATAYVPRSSKPVPVFLFACNRGGDFSLDSERIVKSGFWPVEQIVGRGYATVAFYMSDVTPDRQHGNTLGVFAAFEDVERQYRSKTGWGAISAWAWGASRVLDWIGTEPSLDATKVAVVGHSRGGKTALVAAAWDERFAMACANGSGTGGAKLNHVDLPSSETIRDIAMNFQFWFCRSFTTWANLDRDAPFDQHMLIALLAPRLVCIGSGSEDPWAGPFGEYESARYASAAWTKVYGLKGFVSDGYPPPDTPQQEGDISYHLRTGKHNLTPYDWGVYMDFAAKHGW